MHMPFRTIAFRPRLSSSHFASLSAIVVLLTSAARDDGQCKIPLNDPPPCRPICRVTDSSGNPASAGYIQRQNEKGEWINDSELDGDAGSQYINCQSNELGGLQLVAYPHQGKVLSQLIVNARFRPTFELQPTISPTLAHYSYALAYEIAPDPEKDGKTPTNAKPWWQSIIESSGLAALITVLGGGIIGNYLSNRYQKAAKLRESQLNSDEAAKQRRFQGAQQYLEAEIKVVQEILRLVTSTSSRTEDLVLLTTKRFTSSNDEESTKGRVDMRAKFNAAVDEWKCGRETLGASLGTYHKQDYPVFSKWVEVRRATSSLMDKGIEIYGSFFDNPQPTSIQVAAEKLQTERESLDRAISDFSETLLRFRIDFAIRHDLFDPGEKSAT